MTITETRYNEEVAQQAEYLVEAATEDEVLSPREEVYEAVGDVLVHHNWFARSYHGPADHGAIIEHATHDVDGSLLDGLFDPENPERIIEDMAYQVFEHDVVEAACDDLSEQIDQ